MNSFDFKSSAIKRCKYEDSAGECTAYKASKCKATRFVCSFRFHELYCPEVSVELLEKMWGRLWGLKGWGN